MADVLSADQLFNWQNAGVPGGIEQYFGRTEVPLEGLVENTDISAALDAAIAGAAEHTAILLPPGTYKLESSVSFGGTGSRRNRKNITLRGAGSGTGGTKIELHGTAAFGLSGTSSGAWDYPAGVQTISAGVKGDTRLYINSPAMMDTAGLFLVIRIPNDWTVPRLNADGTDHNNYFMYMITGSGSNYVDFDPPLPCDVPIGTVLFRENGIQDGVNYYIHIEYCGLEKIRFDCSNTSGPSGQTFLATCAYCWFYDVRSDFPTNYNFSIAGTYKSTMQKCWAHNLQDIEGPSATSRNALNMGQNSNLLVWDSIFETQKAGTLFGAHNQQCVLAYNILDMIYHEGVIGSAMNMNHDPGNIGHLMIYNVTPRLQDDGYHASGDRSVAAFNFVTGVVTKEVHAITGNQLPVTLNRWSRHHSLVRNIIGRNDRGITWDYTNISIGWDSTSTTSMTIPAVGDAVQMFIEPGLLTNDSGSTGTFFAVSDDTKWFMGRLTGYDDVTGEVTCTVTRINGAGTFADWVMYGTNGYGTDADTGLIYAFGCPKIGGGGWDGAFTMAIPSKDIWWRCWDGTPMNKLGGYVAGATYNKGDVVTYNVTAPWGLMGGNAAVYWVAANAAKNGLTTWDAPGEFQTDWTPIGQGSFMEVDYDVFTTTKRKENWTAHTSGVHSSEALGVGETVGTYFDETKPANIFGSMVWPPWSFDAVPVDMSTLYTAIPAGYRYFNGVDTPGVVTSVSTPTFAPIAGAFDAPQNVVITCATIGATIHYTVDGSTPTEASPVYSAPIALGYGITTLKAIGVLEGNADSGVRSGMYTITAPTGSQPKGKRGVIGRRR